MARRFRQNEPVPMECREAAVLPLRGERVPSRSQPVEWLEELLVRERPRRHRTPAEPPPPDVMETHQAGPAGPPEADLDVTKAAGIKSDGRLRRPAIRDWPEDDRPRERLLRCGAQSLSDSELLAILIRTGDTRQNAMEQARSLLEKSGGLAQIARLSAADLARLAGLGPAKAAAVLAALALAPRLERSQLEERPQVSNSDTAFRVLREHFRDPSREEIVTLLLDTKNRLLRAVHCTTGDIDSVALEPASLFRDAVREGAAALILSHSHPSGDPAPSSADRRFTSDAVAAGKTLSVRVLDHLIVAGPKYFSFLDEGLMGA